MDPSHGSRRPRRPRSLPRRALVAVTALATGGLAALAAPASASAPEGTASGATAAERSAPQQEEWDPPAELAPGLEEVWRHMEETYPDLYGFPNYGWDQLMANDGALHYCVRWESDEPVTAELRDRVHEVLAEQNAQWIDAVRGFDGFPYDEVPVRVVAWAAADADTLQWDDDAVDRYIGDLDAEGAPRCAPECDRFHNQDGDYSDCPGGDEAHFDQSLWLTDGFGGGAGGDWGQRMGREYFVGSLDQEHITILLHEIGHTYGLDDFYDWTPTGVENFLMKAGTADRITEFDAWMARDFWRHLKDRYDV